MIINSINDIYTISLFGTQFLRISLDRTRLKPLIIHTVRLCASIADVNVAEFENHRHTIKHVFHIMNNTERK